ncbi:MAG: zf-HC2 domain-containing protein [Acidobacteriota bacterium]|nr:zf-HC2 domain-containing protein [Acidobacteriota bacterium]
MQHHEVVDLLPELESGTLGDATRPAVLQHLDTCDECRSWVATCEWFSGALAETSEDPHPSSDQLARYSVDSTRLAEPEREQLAAHLAVCDNCAEEVRLTEAALTGDEQNATILHFGRRVEHRSRAALKTGLAATLAFASLLAFSYYKSHHTRLSGDHLAGTRVVEAIDSIKAVSTTIESGGDVTFRAGKTVVLGEGFSIGSDASFRIEIAQTQREPPVAKQAESPPQT